MIRFISPDTYSEELGESEDYQTWLTIIIKNFITWFKMRF